MPYLGRMTVQGDHRWYADPWTRGDRFRKAREHLGLDQTAFGELINVSRQTVSNYETDITQRPIRAIVAAWALAAGTTKDWLMEGEDMHPDPDDGAAQSSDVVTRQYHVTNLRRMPMLSAA